MGRLFNQLCRKTPVKILRFFREDSFALGLISLVTLISTHKALGFYFWHDDFSWFYLLRNNICFDSWPYDTVCNYLKVIYSVFGLNPFWYFILGVVIFFLIASALYFFLKKIFDRTTSVFLTLLFATAFYGVGVFQEANSPFLALTPLLLFLISLNFLLIGNVLKLPSLFWGILFFGLSVYVSPTRSASHIFPAVALVFLFGDKLTIKKKTIISVILLIVYGLAFFVFPVGGESRLRAVLGQSATGSGFNPLIKIDYFLKTFGAFVVSDEVQNAFFPRLQPSSIDLIRLALSAIIFAGLAFELFSSKSTSRLKKIALFSLIWIVFFYLPYGLRSDWRLASSHRYLISAFPGMVLVWGVFSKYRFWKQTTLLLVIVGLIQTNLFLGQHLNVSKKRADFYFQLHDLLRGIPKGAVLFFNSPAKIQGETTDYFRVGYFPSEASLGTEYKTLYQDVKLVTDNDDFRKYLKQGNVKNDLLFSFFYNGQRLFDTTERTRKILTSRVGSTKIMINKFEGSKFVSDKTASLSTGSNNGVAFDYGKLPLTTPFIISVEVQASIPDIPLPYTQDCLGCFYNPQLTTKSLRYLSGLKEIKRGTVIQTSNAGEGTDAVALLDRNLETFWFADRSLWFKDTKPVIRLDFTSAKEVAGLIVSSSFANRKPTKYFFSINGQESKYSVRDIDGDKELVLFDKNQPAKTLEMKIISTSGGDAPGLTEIDIVTDKFADLDFLTSYKLEKFPTAILKTKEDLKALSDYLATGAKACLKWEASEYGAGEEALDLIVDGKKHLYDIELPAMGSGEGTVNFNLDCLNYPVDLSVLRVDFRPIK